MRAAPRATVAAIRAALADREWHAVTDLDRADVPGCGVHTWSKDAGVLRRLVREGRLQAARRYRTRRYRTRGDGRRGLAWHVRLPSVEAMETPS